MNNKMRIISTFAWRGPSHIANDNPSMRYKPATKSSKPLVQLLLTKKNYSINTETTTSRDKTHKLLKGSI